jgi:hypothetical protein
METFIGKGLTEHENNAAARLSAVPPSHIEFGSITIRLVDRDEYRYICDIVAPDFLARK